MQKVPQDCVDMYVVGKQWMWKAQHPSGVRENQDLHIPVGQAIRLTMMSEDVIHSYYIPLPTAPVTGATLSVLDVRDRAARISSSLRAGPSYEGITGGYPATTFACGYTHRLTDVARRLPRPCRRP